MAFYYVNYYFNLDVEMYDVLFVNISARLAQLTDDHGCRQFSQNEVSVGYPLEQLAAFHSAHQTLFYYHFVKNERKTDKTVVNFHKKIQTSAAS